MVIKLQVHSPQLQEVNYNVKPKPTYTVVKLSPARETEILKAVKLCFKLIEFPVNRRWMKN